MSQNVTNFKHSIIKQEGKKEWIFETVICFIGESNNLWLMKSLMQEHDKQCKFYFNKTTLEKKTSVCGNSTTS